MAVTQVDASISKRAGAELVGKFRMAAREIYFPACRDQCRELVVKDEVLLVNSLGLEKGRFAFNNGKGRINAIPERWVVMGIENSGVLTLQSLQTRRFLQTNPNDGVVKATEILDNDGEVRKAVLDKLDLRADVKITMKKALERITGLVTAFIEGTNVPGTEYSPVNDPRNAAEYLMSLYIGVLSTVTSDRVEKSRLNERLFGLERSQLDSLLLGGEDKYRHLALPKLTDILKGKEEKGIISEGDIILIPHSHHQFIEIDNKREDSYDLRLCSLDFGLDGIVPSVVVVREDRLIMIPTADVLRIYLGVTPEDQENPFYAAWKNEDMIKEFGHISNYSFRTALENYNKSQRAAFERGELIQLLGSFRRAHRRIR